MPTSNRRRPPTWGKPKTPYDNQWRKVRRSVLERDGWRCQLRLDDGCTGRATTVDHTLALADGGDRLHPGNLKAACQHCQVKKAHSDTAERHRREGRAEAEAAAATFTPVAPPGPCRCRATSRDADRLPECGDVGTAAHWSRRW